MSMWGRIESIRVWVIIRLRNLGVGLGLTGFRSKSGFRCHVGLVLPGLEGGTVWVSLLPLEKYPYYSIRSESKEPHNHLLFTFQITLANLGFSLISYRDEH